MSPTLLEGLIAIVLLIVAWQIGMILAPLIFREWRLMRRDLDEVSDAIDSELSTDQRPKEQQHDTHR